MSLGLNLGLGLSKKTSNNWPAFATGDVLANHDFTNAANYTFSAGVVVSSVAAIQGVNFTGADGIEYDSTAFDGLGGLKSANIDNYVIYASNQTFDASMGVAFVAELPAQPSTGNDILSFAASGNGFAVAEVQVSGLGEIFYDLNEASSTQTLSNHGAGVIRYLVVLNFNSTSSVTARVISSVGGDTTTTFDPNDQYSTGNRIRLGTRRVNPNGSAVVDLKFARFVHLSRPFTNAEITQMANAAGVYF